MTKVGFRATHSVRDRSVNRNTRRTWDNRSHHCLCSALRRCRCQLSTSLFVKPEQGLTSITSDGSSYDSPNEAEQFGLYHVDVDVLVRSRQARSTRLMCSLTNMQIRMRG